MSTEPDSDAPDDPSETRALSAARPRAWLKPVAAAAIGLALWPLLVSLLSDPPAEAIDAADTIGVTVAMRLPAVTDEPAPSDPAPVDAASSDTASSNAGPGDGQPPAITREIVVSVAEGATALEATRAAGAADRDAWASTWQGRGEMAFLETLGGEAARPDEGLFWLLEINGVEAERGAGAVRLAEGDRVLWKLAAYE